MVKPPDPIRTPKLSTIGPAQYCGGGPRGNRRWCTFLYYHRQKCDNLAEWLRRWPAKPLCYAREGSNPSVVAILQNTTRKKYLCLIVKRCAPQESNLGRHGHNVEFYHWTRGARLYFTVYVKYVKCMLQNGGILKNWVGIEHAVHGDVIRFWIFPNANANYISRRCLINIGIRKISWIHPLQWSSSYHSHEYYSSAGAFYSFEPVGDIWFCNSHFLYRVSFPRTCEAMLWYYEFSQLQMHCAWL